MATTKKLKTVKKTSGGRGTKIVVKKSTPKHPKTKKRTLKKSTNLKKSRIYDKVKTPKVPGHTNRSLGRLAAGTIIFPNTRQLTTDDPEDIYFYHYIIDEYGNVDPTESTNLNELYPGFVISHHKFDSGESRYPYKVTKVRGPGGIFYVSSYIRVSICDIG
jgi:hypothetical protein